MSQEKSPAEMTEEQEVKTMQQNSRRQGETKEVEHEPDLPSAPKPVE